MEYQTTGWLSPKLKQLEAENARLREELVQANDYANRKADEKQELAEQLAAAQATIEQMRGWMLQNSIHNDSCAVLYIGEDGTHPPCSCGLAKVLTLTSNLDALHEARALECERLKVICEEGFSEFLPNTGGQYALKCMSDILSQEAAAHRARKEGK